MVDQPTVTYPPGTTCHLVFEYLNSRTARPTHCYYIVDNLEWEYIHKVPSPPPNVPVEETLLLGQPQILPAREPTSQQHLSQTNARGRRYINNEAKVKRGQKSINQWLKHTTPGRIKPQAQSDNPSETRNHTVHEAGPITIQAQAHLDPSGRLPAWVTFVMQDVSGVDTLTSGGCNPFGAVLLGGAARVCTCRTGFRAKRNRNTDKNKCPANSHPMQLRLTNEDKTLQAEPKGASVDEGSQGKGKQAASQLRRTSSFYPGYHGLASMSELRTDAPMDLTADEPQSENEDDWIDDSVADRTQGQHAGPSAATANERPTWQGSGTTM
ncbi:hypothetical protein EDB87DRAFT_1695569 [Lactarius vividus]|nr:hypothetical protein EDB87DRAFT_1695569 [Lactarius vividus]